MLDDFVFYKATTSKGAQRRGAIGSYVRAEQSSSFLSKDQRSTVFRMSSVVDLFRQAADLSEDDRATLAGLLIESLETERDPDVEESWRQEIDRRVAQLEAGEVETIPWETVRDQLTRRFDRS